MDLGIPVWGQVSITAALLGIVVWIIIAVLSGRLVTRSHLEDEKQHTADALQEKRDWQEAWQAGQETMALLAPAVKDLSSSAAVVKKFIKSLPEIEEASDGPDK